MNDALNQFRAAIRDAGLSPPDVIEPGKLHRFPGHDKCGANRAAWCKLFDDGLGGCFGDFAQGTSECWQLAHDKPMTNSLREKLAAQVSIARAEAEFARKVLAAEAAQTAARAWAAATPENGEHRYLRDKGIEPHGVRTNGRELLIPMFDIESILHSLQRINPDGSKRYLAGGAIKGHHYIIGEPAGRIVIGEGFATCASIREATGNAVVVAFSAGNLEAVARIIHAKYPAFQIVVAADDDHKTAGNPGITKATAAAKVIGGLLAIPDFGGNRPDDVTDFNDLMQISGADAVRACINHAVDTTPDGAKLLDDVREFIGRFCAFPSAACLDAVTLWAAHAHMVQHFHTTPRLAMLSPEPGSGKTRVLEVLDLLTPDAMLILSPSVAAIFRKLAKTQVTLLFDECDAIFKKRGDDGQNEDLRALINSGYRRGASIPRCVGSEHEVRDFPVFAATALAGLGDLPDTILSRSVTVRMRKRCADEPVGAFRARVHEAPGHALRTRLAGWAAIVGTSAGIAWPKLPDGVEDRKAEIWEPLLAVADQAGGHWSETARVTCVEFCAATDYRRTSLGVRLLADLREIFGGADALPTHVILARLCGTEPYGTDIQGEPVYIAEDAPWSELRGRPLDSRGLARLLDKYEVRSKKIKQSGKSLQGYRREHLLDAWHRYLPGTPPEAEPPEPAEPGTHARAFPAGFEVPDNRVMPEPSPESGTAKPSSHMESSGGSTGSGLPAMGASKVLEGFL